MHSFILQIYQKYTLGGKVLLLTFSDWVTHTDTHPRPAIHKKMVSHLAQIRLSFCFSIVWILLTLQSVFSTVFSSVASIIRALSISVSKKPHTTQPPVYLVVWNLFFNFILIISIPKTFSFYMFCVLRLDASVTFPCWVTEQTF